MHHLVLGGVAVAAALPPRPAPLRRRARPRHALVFLHCRSPRPAKPTLPPTPHAVEVPKGVGG
eukprot:5168062-Alexandrium_andersonii.AAC.1